MSSLRVKRLSSKKKRPQTGNAVAETLQMLGLEAYSTKQLDSASVLNITTWVLENKQPLELKDLPNAFLRRLWLLSEDARSSCCQPQVDPVNSYGKLPEENLCSSEEKMQRAINPLDLITSVFLSADTFLQQEITVRMMQCKFAVPLVLPNADPEKPSQFLLWPSRGVVGQWKSHSMEQNSRIQDSNLASTPMPIVSCVKLGRCSISKSQVLNYVLKGPKSSSDTFIHRDMDGGQVPRRIANGLVEIGWYLPTGVIDIDVYPSPFVICNLRGDGSNHESCLKLLCQASSALIILCGDFKEKEIHLLKYCKEMASKLILIDVQSTERELTSITGCVGQNLEEYLGLPNGAVIRGSTFSEEEVAKNFCEILQHWAPDNLKPVTLEAAAKLALDLGLIMDEGSVCKKAMATVEEVLKGLDAGSVEFQQEQLPLQGNLWSKLGDLDREESKLRKLGTEPEPQLLKEKKDILAELSSYKIKPAMKIFIDALLTKDKIERNYFLTWLKLRLHLIQTEKINRSQESGPQKPKHLENHESEPVISIDSVSFCTDSLSQEEAKVEQENTQRENVQCGEKVQPNLPYAEESITDVSSTTKQRLYCKESFENSNAFNPQGLQPKTYTLSIEHFFREMGLIFEFTHMSKGQNVMRLPNLTADLLLSGVPLELMDGDSVNIPMCWLGCVFAELKRCLRQAQLRTRVLTVLGNHYARNAEVLSGLFGVKLPEGWRGTNKGMYLVVLNLPDDLRKEFDFDVLFLTDVEGLGFVSREIKKDTLIQDNIMATVAVGLSDVVLQNISPPAGNEFETTFNIMVNALLCAKERSAFPICQILTQDEGINCVLQASQLRRVCKILQTQEKSDINNLHALNPNSTTFVRGPWPNICLPEKVEKQYSEDVLKLKEKLFGALKRSANKSEASDFIGRLCEVWEVVKSDLFSHSLQNIDIALVFALLCIEFSQWENSLLENIEDWLMGATKKIFLTKALDATAQNVTLNELKKEAGEEVKSEVNKLKSKAESYMTTEEILKANSKRFWPILQNNIGNLQERVTEEVMQKLETINESHCSFNQIKNFEKSLETEQEFKLLALVETSKSTNLLLQDNVLEEEFEIVWKKTLSSFDFRPSETDDISARVRNVLRQNLISRDLHKHMQKLDAVGQIATSTFQICDDHFGYRSRMKHMFEDNNKQQKLEAQRVASEIIEEYKQFTANKCSLAADFSDTYITELLEMIENGLKEKTLEIRSAFEVDLKIYLCNAACQEFQKLHDRFAKDSELLTYISENKNKYEAEFIYQFRKRDQCYRVAKAFISMVIKPFVLEYINQSLGVDIANEIKSKAQQYQSPHAFQRYILEDLIKEDCFERFVEYLVSYEDFRLRKIQETVVAHLSDTTILSRTKQQRLGEIIGKIAAAISQTEECTGGVLSDTKPLLERVCLILRRDVNLDVEKELLNGPLFSITTEWGRFVKCLIELLATMRLELGKRFNQNVDVLGVLADLPVQPQDILLQTVRGCDKRCPLCKAPCEEEKIGHEVHSSLLHRPKNLLPHDLSSPPHLSCPDTSKDAYSKFMICNNLPFQDPNWRNGSDDLNNKANIYWRYVLVRFNDKFAAEFKQEQATVPEDWNQITMEEALDSLNTVFSRKESS
ncbi:PREDICTED: interferon-induced very large GTPase 1-like [Cyprinodon variegatus]|uniref:GTPase, very large interferon inducible 1-like 2 n=1 Tax=Cyprinodon variegatus TaxID=28743 RepID=A0A3Q2D7S4_CYPVA|nr:PREDICTED: interferon-induced very large GTPase 1-like [Cyprinodon variegatus]